MIAFAGAQNRTRTAPTHMLIGAQIRERACRLRRTASDTIPWNTMSRGTRRQQSQCALLELADPSKRAAGVDGVETADSRINARA